MTNEQMRQRIAELEEGLRYLNTEIDAMWNDPEKRQIHEFYMQSITNAQIHAASLLSATPPASEPDADVVERVDWRALASRLEGLHAQMFGIVSLGDPALAFEAISDNGKLHEAVHDCLRALPAASLLNAESVREGEDHASIAEQKMVWLPRTPTEEMNAAAVEAYKSGVILMPKLWAIMIETWENKEEKL